jgi:hypothetical protein
MNGIFNQPAPKSPAIILLATTEIADTEIRLFRMGNSYRITTIKHVNSTKPLRVSHYQTNNTTGLDPLQFLLTAEKEYFNRVADFIDALPAHRTKDF